MLGTGGLIALYGVGCLIACTAMEKAITRHRAGMNLETPAPEFAMMQVVLGYVLMVMAVL